jgi:hypothetical protein
MRLYTMRRHFSEVEPVKYDEGTKAVEVLIKKASEADKADDALKFSQAATNAANAMCAVKVVEGK